MRQKATEAVPDKIKDMVRNHDNEMHAEVNLIQLEPVTQQFCSLYTGAALHAAALIETLLARLCSTYQLCLQKSVTCVWNSTVWVSQVCTYVPFLQRTHDLETDYALHVCSTLQRQSPRAMTLPRRLVPMLTLAR